MSLRGSEATEAISEPVENEIAALPPVARNDKTGLADRLPGGEGNDGLSASALTLCAMLYALCDFLFK